METAALQAALKSLGLDPGPVDGLMGDKTIKAVRALLDRNKSRLSRSARSSAAHELIAAEQLIYWSAGIQAVGQIDGLVGPSTRQARIEWAALKIGGKPAEPWRDELMKPRDTDASMPEPVRTIWPVQRDVEKYYGAIGKNHATLKFPFPMRLDWDRDQIVRTTTVHEKVHDSAERVFRRILSHYGEDEITRLGLDQFGGCYNPRKMRGGSAWSMHAWAIAFDFDPDRNQLNWGRDRAQLAKPEYDAFWRFWTEEGWLSLGKARNFDWMHVQAARL